MSADEKPRVVPLRRPRCPICGRRAEPEHKPFCSRHCANVDLVRWFGDAYKVPTEESPEGSSPGNDEE